MSASYFKINKLNQKGIVHFLVLVIVLLGIVAGVYLVKQTQIFKSKASLDQSVVFLGEGVSEKDGRYIATKLDGIKVKLTSPIEPTPTPIPASIPDPTNLSVRCPAPGTAANLSWNAVSEADRYTVWAFDHDPTQRDWSNCVGGGPNICGYTVEGGDSAPPTAVNNLAVWAGTDYRWYVFACKGNKCSPKGASVRQTCTSGNPSPVPSNDAQFSSISCPMNPTLKPGESVPFSVSMVNKGNTVWGPNGVYRLGILDASNPDDVNAGDNLGLLLQVPHLPMSSDIKPGETARVEYRVTAPQKPGTYKFQWQMVQEGVAWFGQRTSPCSITVSAPQTASACPPSNMTPGQTAPVSITMKNNTDTVWPVNGAYRLGSQNPADNSTWGLHRAYNSSDVAPNTDYTFNFNVTAPQQEGTYNFQWQMLEEGVRWVGDPTPNCQVSVGGNVQGIAKAAEPPYTTHFKVAKSQVMLANAPLQEYTSEPMYIDFTFDSTSPGTTETLYVAFIRQEGGREIVKETRQAIITYQPSVTPPPNQGVGTPQVWFGPSGASVDMLDLFNKPEKWTLARSKIDVFQFRLVHLTDDDTFKCSDSSVIECGENTLQNLIRADAFSKLKQWGISIGVEAPSIWTCDADYPSSLVKAVIRNVQSNGGTVSYVAMDSPYYHLTKLDAPCRFSREAALDRTAQYITRIKSTYPNVLIGDIEPYPAFDEGQHESWVNELEARGAKLDFFRLDINQGNEKMRGKDMAADLRKLKGFVESRGIPFGIIFTDLKPTSVNDNQAYYNEVIKYVATIKAAIGQPTHSVFYSWLISANNKLEIPINLPENDPDIYSHTRLLNDAYRILNPDWQASERSPQNILKNLSGSVTQVVSKLLPTPKPAAKPAPKPTVKPTPRPTVQETRDNKRKSDLAAIQAALEKYKAKNGKYPVTSWRHSTQGSNWLPGLNTYFSSGKIPQDPVNNGAFYSSGAKHYAYSYYSSPAYGGTPGSWYMLVAALEKPTAFDLSTKCTSPNKTVFNYGRSFAKDAYMVCNK